VKTGAQLIARERTRGINVEGWTAKHDDIHRNGELALAANCYAEMAYYQIGTSFERASHMASRAWPFEMSWWKPCIDPQDNLIKAGALIAAEIDRLNRAKAKKARLS